MPIHFNDRRRQGFTIIEMVIVIIVIAILALITVVSYNGIQQRTNDTRRKNDLASLAKLMNVYSLRVSPMYVGSGCGSGNGSGWLNYTYTGQTNIMDCLKSGAGTSVTIQDDKPNCSGLSCHAYMVATCKQDGIIVTYLYANLEGVDHTGTELDLTCNTGWDSSYGMNYFVKVKYE